MSENSQAAVENLLVDTFMASLLDPKNVHDTTRPLDVPVNIMKKDIVKKYFADKVKDVALYEYSLEYQDNLKQDFADSKSGIGPFALNNPHHVLGQLTGLYMNMPDELSNLGNFHQVTGIDGIHILDWLSALISAHVDVAKDNYIIKLNVNSYTYNMTNFLIRSGMGKNSLLFVSQEIIKELANEYIQSKGVYGFDKGEPFYRRFNNKKSEIFNKYLDKATSLANTKEQKELLKVLNSSEFVVTDGLLAEIPESGKLSRLEQLLDIASKNKKDFDYYVDQLRIYKLFDKISPYAQALSELVKASQVDTKKFGKNAIEMQNFLNKVEDCYHSPFFDPEMIHKFFSETFLLRKIENSIDFSLGLLSNINIQAKPEYFDIFQKFVHCSGLSSLSNERSIGEISNAIDSSWRAFCLYSDMNSPLIGSLENLKNLFVGDNTIAKRLNKLKKDILNDAINGGNKYPNITVTNGRISNLLLNSLTGINDFSKKGIDYLRFDYKDDIASNASRQIREYWQELLESDNDEVADFAYDLIKYAVFTGHGTKHLNALYDFIPRSVLSNLGYFKYVRKIENDEYTLSESVINGDYPIDEIYRNNWFNDTLVPTIQLGEKKASVFSYISQGRNKQVALINHRGRKIAEDNNGTGLYTPYVKARVKGAMGGYNLYKFVGVFQKIKNDTVEEKPLYVLVNKKGYRESGKGFVTEYIDPNVTLDLFESKMSFLPGNNVALKFKDSTGKLQWLEDNPEVLDKFINGLINKNGKFGTFKKANTIEYIFQLDGLENETEMTEVESEDGDIIENVNNTVPATLDEFVKENDKSDGVFEELDKLGEQRKKECE